ncbi:MAG: TonB family protein [Alistipes sp.]|nr:TonB family protein [Alistipes sp.]
MTDDRRQHGDNVRLRSSGQRRATPRRRSVSYGTRPLSAGEWLYEHRLGLCAVLLMYAVAMGAMWSARIYVEKRPVEYEVVFDMAEEPTVDELERLRRRRDELIKEIEQRQFDWSQVKNVSSNEASQNNASSMPQYDAQTRELMDKVASDAAANRSEYERGMQAVGAIGHGGGQGGGGGEGDSSEKGKFAGRVTVSYEFRSPVRSHRSLYTPAYRCQGGGEVVVAVWVDHGGKVVSARVKSFSGSDASMKEVALDAARRSTFEINPQAPSSHEGEITYIFIPQ